MMSTRWMHGAPVVQAHADVTGCECREVVRQHGFKLCCDHFGLPDCRLVRYRNVQLGRQACTSGGSAMENGKDGGHL